MMVNWVEVSQAGKHTAVQGKMGLLFLIHDMLPSEDEESGLTSTEIKQHFNELGIKMDRRQMDRLFVGLMNMAYVDYEGERPRCFRRLYSYRLTTTMVGGILLPNGLVVEVPDWSSEIQFRR